MTGIFLNKTTPLIVIFSGLLVWVFLFIISPLEVKVPISIEPVFFLIINIAFLCLGVVTLNNKKMPINEEVISRNIQTITLFLALSCVLLKLIDKFYIREGTFIESTFNNRDSFEQGGSNPVAIMSSVLTGFTYIPLFLASYSKKAIPLLKWVLFYFIFFSSVFDIFLIGSRSTTLLSFFIYVYYLFLFDKITINTKKIIFYLFFILIVGLWMGVVFIERSREFAGEEVISYILKDAGFTSVIGPNDKLINAIEQSDSDLFQTVCVAYISLLNYYVHGVIEFLYVYDKFNAQHTCGRYTFYIYYKFFHIILTGNVPNFQTIADVNPRPAVYTSFYGPIFFDFGWLSIVFSYLLGIFTKNVYNRAANGFFADKIVYSYMINLLFFLPVFNFIEGAAGLYVISSFIIFKLLTRFL